MEKHLFNYKSKKEFETYLKSLTFKKICNVALTIENILSELDAKAYDLIYYLDFKVKKKILDDIYYNNIKNYNLYLKQTIDNLKKYLLNNIYSFFNELDCEINYNNIDNKNGYTYITFPLINKNNIIENLINLYSSSINVNIDDLKDWNIFSTPRKPYSYKAIHLISNNVETLITNIQEQTKDYDNKLLIDITNQIKKMLELYTGLIIDTNEIFKKYISKNTYNLLEKYNCLETIGLVKYPSIIGVDNSDIFNFFKDSKIIKIIDGNITHEIQDGKPNKCLFIYAPTQKFKYSKK